VQIDILLLLYCEYIQNTKFLYHQHSIYYDHLGIIFILDFSSYVSSHTHTISLIFQIDQHTKNNARPNENYAFVSELNCVKYTKVILNYFSISVESK
jgi:hypothetical protein